MDDESSRRKIGNVMRETCETQLMREAQPMRKRQNTLENHEEKDIELRTTCETQVAVHKHNSSAVHKQITGQDDSHLCWELRNAGTHLQSQVQRRCRPLPPTWATPASHGLRPAKCRFSASTGGVGPMFCLNPGTPLAFCKCPPTFY
ncbi:hypothetical protein HAX54_016820, partial [Datura stramonium]|nr:hypothetical protein [Datura stramonium]